MALPDSIKAFGEQIEAGGEIAPGAELFEAYDVFAAELAQIFTRPWLAVDHASRLTADGDYVRADVGARSVVVVRETADKIHALRNTCLHAGYRVCEAEAGNAENLYCVYHGWSYALDGLLTDPLLRPQMTDRSRFRLPRHPLRIERGLIFVDLSQVAPEAPPAGEIDLGALPDLGGRAVGARRHYAVAQNWKRVRHFLWQSPGLAFGDGCEVALELGPLSLVALRGGDAALIRINPRFPAQCDVELIELPRAPVTADDTDPLGEALREESEAIAAAPLDRDFCEWYWRLLAPAA